MKQTDPKNSTLLDNCCYWVEGFLSISAMSSLLTWWYLSHCEYMGRWLLFWGYIDCIGFWKWWWVWFCRIISFSSFCSLLGSCHFSRRVNRSPESNIPKQTHMDHNLKNVEILFINLFIHFGYQLDANRSHKPTKLPLRILKFYL